MMNYISDKELDRYYSQDYYTEDDLDFLDEWEDEDVQDNIY
ncbi:MAG: hypothetical protein ACLULK_01730 [Anaerovoracaceae bacterium]|jgi:hypothetical protein|uniref:Uncharacterized protein n=1 Tax=virus sp. ctyMK1 TaxID=2828002 RepID=A0A8S5RFK0_9VIRU|nr:MAG TPA: hypothetical protein [virus sp. ctyMK1]